MRSSLFWSIPWLSVWVGCGGLSGENHTPPPQTTALVPAASAPPAQAVAHGVRERVYVPVYSSIYINEGSQTLDLTVTLSVRNTDDTHPITVTSVRYLDTKGQLLHAYVDAPTPLAPLASADTVVQASDRRAGVGGSFVVEWVSDAPVTEPVIEAVMIGAAYQQGVSFVSQGRVLSREER